MNIKKILDMKALTKEYDAYKRNELKSNKVYTGFENYDQTVKYMKKGQISYLCARPSVGKTTLSINVLSNILPQLSKGECAVFFSLDVTNLEIYEKLLILEEAKNPLATPEELKEHIENYPLYVVDSQGLPKITPSWIENTLKEITTNSKYKNVRVVFIDYFQTITSDEIFSIESERLASVSRSLKQIARTNDSHFFVIAQLNRTADAKGKGSYSFSDIKGTGAVEQDADIITVLSNSNKVTILDGTVSMNWKILKNRNGGLGDFDLIFNPELQKFTEPLK
ncbi:DnaB-like helicase C-terminal domain-containing protein [Mycoplasmopsis felifaucium]|uniref:DnaB-like helicase C-terminal domain-containing protein n=1 Tax=Mycoplasmopsis felifaucium TaxID=35768 RepID=UPI000482071C|nr:DnaB-like helicase C-terminal domain-containing protein [Mycoplasmopsis felifaucium]